MDEKKCLALIAHNNMKDSLIDFSSMQINKHEQFPLIEPGSKGSLLIKKRASSYLEKLPPVL